MKLALLTALLSTALLTSLMQPNPGADERATLEREVNEFLREYLATLEAKDSDRIPALYAADDRFAWYTDGKLAYQSADEVLRGMAYYGDIKFKTSLSATRIVPLTETLVSVRTAFETQLTLPDAQPSGYSGAITMLLEKTDARWRIVLGHTSTPGGPPARDQQESR